MWKTLQMMNNSFSNHLEQKQRKEKQSTHVSCTCTRNKNSSIEDNSLTTITM